MIPTQEFENFPEFANAGEKTQPNDQKYAQGFLPSDTLPAEWQNWFLAGATRGITALDTGLSSVEAEINTVLQSRQEQPSATATNQLLTVLEKIKAEAILAAHPVGSLYWTSKNENPAITFGGGTWKQIKDKFILAAGDTYTAEATGGSATMTLDITQIPAHTHGLNSHTHTLTPAGTVSSHSHGLNSHTHTLTPAGTVSSHSHGLGSHTHTLTPAGTVSSHSHGLNSHTHSVGAHSHGLNSHQHGMDHMHLFTPSGTVSSHRHGLNSHTHSVGAHSHGLNSHTHSFTPAGTISGGAHSHTINSGNTSSSGTTTTAGFRGVASGAMSANSTGYFFTAIGATGNRFNDTIRENVYAYAYSGPFTASKYTSYSAGDFETASLRYNGTKVTMDISHTHIAKGYLYGSTDSATPSMTFSGTAGTTGAASGSTANSTAFDTGAASGNTADATPSFIGRQDDTSTGRIRDSDGLHLYVKTDAATGNTANSTAFNTGVATGNTEDSTPTFTGTQGTTSAATGNTAAATPTFTGTQGTTSAATGNTAASTPTFTGTQGTTSAATGDTTSTGGSSGVTQAVNIMPPYEVKYCWERTA